jgi:predicted ribosome quality control (RQC) complex YloA/Tae2 family protein
MDENIRVLADLRDRAIQKNRIAFGNRMVAIQSEKDTTNLDLEQDLDKDIAEIIDGVEIVERLTDVRGIGNILAAKLISMIEIERSPSVSSLWRYAGLAVIDGEHERKHKGEPLHYNERLKSTVIYNIGGSFLKANSPYRKIYDESKEYYQLNRPEWVKLRCHYAAIRKMMKVFLSHLWLVWREMEGLPTRNLYVEEYKGHTHIITPQEMGWRDWK